MNDKDQQKKTGLPAGHTADLPLASLAGGPLAAAAQAQEMLATATMDFVQKAASDARPGGHLPADDSAEKDR